MSKKQTLSDVFTTEKVKKEREVLKAIKRYCVQIGKEDIDEVHSNVVEYFELNEQDTYFNKDRFREEIKKQKELKLQKDKKQEHNQH